MDVQARKKWFQGRLEPHRMNELWLKIFGWFMIALGIGLAASRFLTPDKEFIVWIAMVLLLLGSVSMQQAKAHRLAREDLEGLQEILRVAAPGDGQPEDHNS